MAGANTSQRLGSTDRRLLLRMIGGGSGRCCHVSSHERARVRCRVRLYRAGEASGQPPRRLGSHSRRRHGGHDRRAGTARCRLQGAGPRVQQRPGRPQLGAVWRRHVRRAGGHGPACQVRARAVSESGSRRLPHHHLANPDHSKRLEVALEPFIQVNYNAYVHSTRAFGGKPPKNANTFNFR